MIPDIRPRRLAGSEVRAIAVAAELHPRTVERALAGRPIRPASLQRLERVLRKQGRLELLPREEIKIAHEEIRVAAAEARLVHQLEKIVAAAGAKPPSLASLLAAVRQGKERGIAAPEPAPAAPTGTDHPEAAPAQPGAQE